jgi:hypothetical protein
MPFLVTYVTCGHLRLVIKCHFWCSGNSITNGGSSPHVDLEPLKFIQLKTPKID